MKTECYALLDLPYKRGQTVSVSRNSILALTCAYEGASVVEFRNYHGNRAESIGRLLGNWGDSLAKFEIVMGVGATGLPITANGGDVIADLTLPGMETRDAMKDCNVIYSEQARILGRIEGKVERIGNAASWTKWWIVAQVAVQLAVAAGLGVVLRKLAAAGF